MGKQVIFYSTIERLAEEIFEIVESNLRGYVCFEEAWQEIDYHIEDKIRNKNIKSIIQILKEEIKELPNDN